MKPLKTLAAAAFAAALLCAQASANAPALSAQIAAKVNSQIITNYDVQLYESALNISADEAFSTLLRERLIASLLSQRKLHISEQAVSAQMAEELKNLPDAKQISADELEFVRQIARAKVGQKLLFDDVVASAKLAPPSDEQVREFYAKNLAASGASLQHEEAKIRAFLFNQSAERAIADFLEREEGRANVQIMEQK